VRSGFVPDLSGLTCCFKLGRGWVLTLSSGSKALAMLSQGVAGWASGFSLGLCSVWVL
jgi:hypothetical protein